MPEIAGEMARMQSLQSLNDYLRYRDETAELKAEKRAVMARLRSDAADAPTLSGYSVTADAPVDFTINTKMKRPDGTYNLRETVNCPKTGFNMRKRAAVHAVKHFETDRSCRIYISEQRTRLFRYFSAHYDDLSGSEYLGDKVPLGSEDASGLRNEDATQLTYADDSFDVALSFEVLEHIPDYHKALEETHRVLRPGGRFYFTAPFIASMQKTLIRAKIENGEIVHILKPEYHGDPVRKEGILCFQHFGWDIVDDLQKAGFREVRALVFDQIEYGYYDHEPIPVFRAVA